jgi:hypothetical protein
MDFMELRIDRASDSGAMDHRPESVGVRCDLGILESWNSGTLVHRSQIPASRHSALPITAISPKAALSNSLKQVSRSSAFA